jgi:antitoxin component of MazEF toxin-antitoxin module
VLLEEYSPRWYAEKQRNRALVARRPPKEVLFELVALLEEYSPSWYTEEQRDRAFAALRASEILE